jgi:hypothetical protein
MSMVKQKILQEIDLLESNELLTLYHFVQVIRMKQQATVVANRNDFIQNSIKIRNILSKCHTSFSQEISLDREDRI